MIPIFGSFSWPVFIVRLLAFFFDMLQVALSIEKGKGKFGIPWEVILPERLETTL